MFQNLTYQLLDAARLGPFLAEAKTRNRTHDSLYRGRSEQDLEGVAPYLFQFAYKTDFANWFLKKGWGDSWGILLKSSWPMQELHKHFRKFLMVETEDKKQLYFRFYDPRVLRIFLPTCDSAQIREFFGESAIDFFIMEDADPAFALRFWHENGQLRQDRIPVAELIASLPEPEPLPEPKQDPLPPETIEALRAQGMLEQVMEARGEATPPAGTTRDEIQALPQKPARPVEQATEEALPPPKPKSRWNMFD